MESSEFAKTSPAKLFGFIMTDSLSRNVSCVSENLPAAWGYGEPSPLQNIGKCC